MEHFEFQEFSQLQGDWKELRLGLEERDALDRILKRLHTENAFSSVKEEKETADASCVESRQFGKNPVTVETLNDQLLQTRNMDDFRQWLKDASDLLMERGTLPLETKKKELQLKRNMCNEMSKILENLKEQLQELGDKTNDAESLVESFLRDMGDTMEHYGYSTELLHVLSNHLSSLDFVQSTMQSLNQKHLNPFHSEFWQKWKDVENILRNIILSNAHVSETHELLVQSLELELELFDQVRYHFQSYMSRTCIETLEASHCITVVFAFAKKKYQKAYKTRSCDINKTFSSLNAELHRNSALYSYFRSTGSKTRSWMVAIESRLNSGFIAVDDGISNGNSVGVIIQSRLQKAAEKALMECQDSYLKARQKTVETIFFHSFSEFRKIQDISQMARTSGSMLLKLLQMEQELFEAYFNLSETCGKYLASMLDVFCSHFYYVWRPRIVEEQNLPKLVDIIEIFKSEILPEDKASENISIARNCSKKILQLAIADAQERITYLTQIYIRNEIQSYTFTQKDWKRCCSFGASDSQENRKEEETIVEKNATNYRQAVLPFSYWYPPVERTLKLLAMLYRRMGTEVFSGLAEEAVSSCVNVLILSSQQMKQFQSRENEEEHSLLFLMSQLWVLREQIQPFDADFSYQERFLNLSELRNSMLRMIWRSKSRNEEFTDEPHRQVIYDSKRSLEAELKKACSNYIMFLCNIFLEPLLSLLSEMNSASSKQETTEEANIAEKSPPVIGQSTMQESRDDNEGTAYSETKTETFQVNPESIKTAWSNVWHLLEQKLPPHVELFKRYIRSSKCQEQLLSSVCSNTSTSCMELLTALQTKYTLEQREQIGIDGLRIQQLVSRLKEICGLDVDEESNK